MAHDLTDRYQNQITVVRLWRWRYILLASLSFTFFFIRIKFWKFFRSEKRAYGAKFFSVLGLYRSLEIGWAQGKMLWYYTVEETNRRLRAERRRLEMDNN